MSLYLLDVYIHTLIKTGVITALNLSTRQRRIRSLANQSIGSDEIKTAAPRLTAQHEYEGVALLDDGVWW